MAGRAWTSVSFHERLTENHILVQLEISSRVMLHLLRLTRRHFRSTHWQNQYTLFSRRYTSSITPGRLSKYTRRSGYIVVGLGTVYVIDHTYNASSILRNLRTLWTVRLPFSFIGLSFTQFFCKCIMITLDYKWNFTPEKSEFIPQLHERVAERVFNLFTSNGGLYIKIGCDLFICFLLW